MITRAITRGDDHGQALVEFALVLPIVLLLLFGILQVALVLEARQTVAYAARVAADNYARTLDRASADAAAAEAGAQLRPQLRAPVASVSYAITQEETQRCVRTQRRSFGRSSCSQYAPSRTTTDRAATSGAPGKNGDLVIARVTYRYPSPVRAAFGPFRFPSEFAMTEEGVARIEAETPAAKTIQSPSGGVRAGPVRATTQASVATGTGTWTTVAPMPAARTSAAAAVIGDTLYVAGGHNGKTDDPSLQAFDTKTGAWRTLAPMPGGRYEGNGAAVIDGKLYVPGGWTTRPPLPSSSLFVYDPATNTWTTKASMPTLSGCGASAAIGGKLYVTTACNGYSGYRNFLHVYDPASNSWGVLASSPNVHSDPVAGVIGGKLFIAGGLDGSGTARGTLDVYDPALGTWTTKATMPTARAGASGGVINGKLYVAGGGNGPQRPTTVEVYDPVTDKWTTEPSMPTALNAAASAVAGGVLYVAGGSDGKTGVTTTQAFAPRAP